MASSVASQSTPVLSYLEKFRAASFQERDLLILANAFIGYIQNPQTMETAAKVKDQFLEFLNNRYSSIGKLSEKDLRIVSIKTKISNLVRTLYTARNYKTNLDPRQEIVAIVTTARNLNTALGIRAQACIVADTNDSDSDDFF